MTGGQSLRTVSTRYVAAGRPKFCFEDFKTRNYVQNTILPA